MDPLTLTLLSVVATVLAQAHGEIIGNRSGKILYTKLDELTAAVDRLSDGNRISMEFPRIAHRIIRTVYEFFGDVYGNVVLEAATNIAKIVQSDTPIILADHQSFAEAFAKGLKDFLGKDREYDEKRFAEFFDRLHADLNTLYANTPSLAERWANRRLYELHAVLLPAFLTSAEGHSDVMYHSINELVKTDFTFVNRKALLRDLNSWLKKDQSDYRILSGNYGIGKQRLALQLCLGLPTVWSKSTDESAYETKWRRYFVQDKENIQIDQWNQLFAKWKEPHLLVVDNAHEHSQVENVLLLLAQTTRPRVKVLFLTTHFVALEDRISVASESWIKNYQNQAIFVARSVPPIEVGPLVPEDIKMLVGTVQEDSEKFYAMTEGNPLHAYIVKNKIETGGEGQNDYQLTELLRKALAPFNQTEPGRESVKNISNLSAIAGSMALSKNNDAALAAWAGMERETLYHVLERLRVPYGEINKTRDGYRYRFGAPAVRLAWLLLSEKRGELVVDKYVDGMRILVERNDGAQQDAFASLAGLIALSSPPLTARLLSIQSGLDPAGQLIRLADLLGKAGIDPNSHWRHTLSDPISKAHFLLLQRTIDERRHPHLARFTKLLERDFVNLVEEFQAGFGGPGIDDGTIRTKQFIIQLLNGRKQKLDDIHNLAYLVNLNQRREDDPIAATGNKQLEILFAQAMIRLAKYYDYLSGRIADRMHVLDEPRNEVEPTVLQWPQNYCAVRPRYNLILVPEFEWTQAISVIHCLANFTLLNVHPDFTKKELSDLSVLIGGPTVIPSIKSFGFPFQLADSWDDILSKPECVVHSFQAKHDPQGSPAIEELYKYYQHFNHEILERLYCAIPMDEDSGNHVQAFSARFREALERAEEQCTKIQRELQTGVTRGSIPHILAAVSQDSFDLNPDTLANTLQSLISSSRID